MYQSEGEIRLTEEERGRDKSEGEMEYRYIYMQARCGKLGLRKRMTVRKAGPDTNPFMSS